MQRMFKSAVAAVRAEHYLPPHLPKDRPSGRTVMIALGKAAGDMAHVALRHIEIDQGLVIAPEGGVPAGTTFPDTIEVITAAHPVPDTESLRAGSAALTLANSLGAEDRLLMLVSGGGSSLMVAPVQPLTLDDKIALNQALLASGAPIHVLNRIRRQLSQLKGGGLAAAASPAEIVTLVLSDIPGDDLSLVASGPTIPFGPDSEWRSLARNWGITLPDFKTRRHAIENKRVLPPILVASAKTALSAMAAEAQKAGFECLNLGYDLEGDAEGIAISHAKIAIEAYQKGRPIAILSGGEASVAIGRYAGKGGRNLTYALGLAKALNGNPDISAFAGDSDGIDGNSKYAGGMIFPDTLARCAGFGLDAADILKHRNAELAFAALNDGISSGPTCTNVNDLRCILVH